MNTYVSFIRGINVSGQKLIKMDDLRKSLESAGFTDVETYIQSGNIVLKSALGKKSVEVDICKLISDRYGFDVEVIVKTPDELKVLLENNPFESQPDFNVKSMYFILLKEAPVNFVKEYLISTRQTTEVFEVNENIVYLYAPDGFGRTVYNNNYFEKKLKVKATTRNWNTINKMIELAK